MHTCSEKRKLKTYLRVSQKIETKHIYNESMKVHCYKILDSTSIKNHIKRTNFMCICTKRQKNRNSSFSDVHLEIVFHTSFNKIGLILKFVDNVHLYIHYGCVSFQII